VFFLEKNNLKATILKSIKTKQKKNLSCFYPKKKLKKVGKVGFEPTMNAIQQNKKLFKGTL
jgi:hypothetical protein